MGARAPGGGGGGGGGERKEEGGAERRGRSPTGAAPRRDPRTVQSEGSGATGGHAAAAAASGPAWAASGTCSRSFSAAAPRAASPGSPASLPPAKRVRALVVRGPRRHRGPQPSCSLRGLGPESRRKRRLARRPRWPPEGAPEARVWGPAEGAAGVTQLPSQDGAPRAARRPRRRCPVPAAG